MGAVSVNAVWLFWIILPIAALGALVYVFVPAVVQALRRAGAYEGLMSAAAHSKQKVNELTKELEEAKSRHAGELVEARTEGGRAALGAVYATLAEAKYELRDIGIRDGKVLVAAQRLEGASYTGALYGLWTSPFEVRQGIMVVREAGDEDNIAVMECVFEDVPEFWEGLRERARAGDKPPPALLIKNCSIDELPEAGFKI